MFEGHQVGTTLVPSQVSRDNDICSTTLDMVVLDQGKLCGMTYESLGKWTRGDFPLQIIDDQLRKSWTCYIVRHGALHTLRVAAADVMLEDVTIAFSED